MKIKFSILAILCILLVGLPVIAFPDRVTASGDVRLPFDKNLGSWYGYTYNGHDMYGQYQYSAVDFNLPNCEDTGKEIYAIQDGYVSDADPVILKHTVPLVLRNGYTYTQWLSMYGHMKDVQVAPNTWVAKGTLLGYISNEGLYPKTDYDPHLHFVLFTDYNNSINSSISPYWLPGDYYDYSLYRWHYGVPPADLYETRIFRPMPFSGPPKNPSISIAKTILNIGENATFNFSATGAEWYVIGIDKGNNRIETKEIGGNTSYSRTFTEPGNYSAYITASNANGWIDSERVYFTVLPEYQYSVSSGQAQITRYNGIGGDIVIPKTIGGYPVTSIGDRVFNESVYQDYILSVLIPEGVKHIGEKAFADCDKLSSVSFPSTLKTIGNTAFFHDVSLSNVILPSGIESIGYGAFSDCYSLSNIYIPNGSVGDFAFHACTGLISITFGKNISAIGRGAFQACNNVSQIDLPASVRQIGLFSFDSCNKLQSITFNSSTTIISQDSYGDRTIAAQAKIIGYSTSTAKDYAIKYGRNFEPFPIIKFRLQDFFDSNRSIKEERVTFSSQNFVNPSNIYNHDLAKVCSLLSASAYDQALVRESVNNLGFIPSRLFQFNYPDLLNSPNTVAFTLAMKTIQLNGISTDLVAVIVRGTANKEWYGNFDVGFSYTHNSFQQATNFVASTLYSYLQDYASPDRPLKIMVTGHSRGAAIANILAKELNDGKKATGEIVRWPFTISKNDVYAYTYATPNVSSNIISDVSNYNNIFNFAEYNDFVTRFPMSGQSWKFGKYGITCIFAPDRVSFKKLTNVDFIDYNDRSAVNNFITNLGNNIPSVADYYQKPFVYFLPGSVVPGIPLAFTLVRDYMDCIAGAACGNVLDIGRIAYQAINPSIIGTISRFFVYNKSITSMINHAHAPETYISWLNSLPNGFVFDKPLSTTANKYSVSIQIRCPVDVYIYDNNNKLVGSVINNTVDNNIENPVQIELSGNNNDEKLIILPTDVKFSIRMVATDEGVMSFSRTIVSNETSEVVLNDTKNNVILENGKQMTAMIEPISDADIEQTTKLDTDVYALTDNGLSKIQPDGQELPASGVSIIGICDVGGSVSGSGVYEVNSLVNLTASADVGYNFVGWFQNGVLVTDQANLQINAKNNQSYVALFDPIKKLIYFNSNGGSKDEFVLVDKLSLLAQPINPVKDGYTFVGWYKTSELTQSWNFGIDVIIDDMTLYAKWLMNTSIKLTSNKNPSMYGESIDLIGTIDPSAATGIIEIYDGITLLGQGSAKEGVFTISIGALGVGTHNLTAKYCGNDQYATSVSPVLMHETRIAISVPQDITVVLTGPLTQVSIGTATARSDSAVIVTNDALENGFPIGTTFVTWTAKDANGNVNTAIQKVIVTYDFGGFLQPINTDGSSVFKAGSTIPVKFQLTDANKQFVSTAQARLSFTREADNITGTVTETVITAAATIGDLFKYDPTANQYVFNLSTKDMLPGTYRLTVNLDDGTSHEVVVSLK